MGPARWIDPVGLDQANLTAAMVCMELHKVRQGLKVNFLNGKLKAALGSSKHWLDWPSAWTTGFPCAGVAFSSQAARTFSPPTHSVTSSICRLMATSVSAGQSCRGFLL
jgi:hypothetical protein